QQAPDAPMDLDAPFGGGGDSRQHLQERALPGPIPADNPDDLTFLDVEGHVPQRPEHFGGATPPRPRRREHTTGRGCQRIAQGGKGRPSLADPKLLPYRKDANRRRARHHTTSAKLRSRERKWYA